MTALSAYDRIEATGLWRDTPDAQRREVIVSIGDATLTITDTQDRALAHWSIPAVARANPGHIPAIFHPDGDPGETLELSANETDMIGHIEKLRTAVERSRPHPGRLRLVSLLMSVAAVVALGLFWLPGALVDHTVSVVPDAKRQTIGRTLLGNIRRISGQPCRDPNALSALSHLATRLPSPSGPVHIEILHSGVRDAVHLPGGIILLNRALIEDFEEPDVAAGYIIAEHLRAQIYDPLRRLLKYSGLVTTFRLLTTGNITDDALIEYSEHLLTAPPPPLADQTLLAGFNAWSVRASPYAYARDISGETTLPLIEADPFTAPNPPADPLISDSDWVRLQNICGG